MLMTGSNSYMGSFEFDTGSDMRQPFLQHWFQEEFLHSFYEDEEFRNQVLRCLLSKTEADSIIPMRIERKPRRTWLKDFECTGLSLTRDDEVEEDSYCSDEKSMLTSERLTCRDAMCQCPERVFPGTSCLCGALWSLVSDVPIRQETIDAICHHPEPVGPGGPTNPLCEVPTEGPEWALYPGEKQWHVANCSQPSEEDKGPASKSDKWKGRPLYQLGPGSADDPRSETDIVHPVAAWPRSVCVDLGTTSREFEFSRMLKAPGLIFSSNPLVSRDWEDEEIQFNELQEHSPMNEPASAPPQTCAVKEEPSIPTPLNVEEESREVEAELAEERPRSMLCSWDSLLKRLFKVKVRVGFRHVNLGRRPGQESSKSTSNEPSANLPRPGGKVYQI